jgi:hypothetical protein
MSPPRWRSVTTTDRAPGNDDLFHALAARARAASDGSLVLAVILGLAATLGIALWRPVAWLLLVSLGVVAAAFGAWGIADRELADHSRGISATLLRGVRLLSVVVGACAASVAALKVLGAVLGTWIS